MRQYKRCRRIELPAAREADDVVQKAQRAVQRTVLIVDEGIVGECGHQGFEVDGVGCQNIGGNRSREIDRPCRGDRQAGDFSALYRKQPIELGWSGSACSMRFMFWKMASAVP